MPLSARHSRNIRLAICFLILCLPAMQGLAQTPVISSFSPGSGAIGSTVTITGSGFSATASSNIVYFGAVRAVVNSASANSLSVTVPVGASFDPITVTANGLTAWSAKPFTVTFAGGAGFTNTSFDAPSNFPTNLHPNGIVLMDFDGDGKPDLATPDNFSTTGSPAYISILRNTGSVGTVNFAQNIDLPVGVLTYALAAGDLNGDGKPDMVSTSIQDRTISVFINTSTVGNISFAPKVDIAVGGVSDNVAIRDIDGDGKPDIIILTSSAGLPSNVSVFRNTSTGGVVSFAARQDFVTGFSPTGLAIADLNGDGKPDLAVTNNLSNTVSIFKNGSTPGTIAFTRQDIATTSGTDDPFGIAIADIDGDGLPDLVITNDNVNYVNAAVYSFCILRNTGSGGAISFAAPLNFSSGNGYNPCLGDLNGDGKPDVVVPNDNSYNNIGVFQNTSVPGTISLSIPPGIYSSGSPYSAVTGDLDGDGLPDLAFANFVRTSVSVFRSTVIAPSISSFSPLQATVGATVTITGVRFTGVTAVSFGGVAAASFTIVSDTRIDAVLGAGSSGLVKVTGPHGSDAVGLFLYIARPRIASFSPAAAAEGATVKITGTDLNTVNFVSFGGVAASSYQFNPPDTIAAVVGEGATGSVRVTTSFGTDSVPGFSYNPVPGLSSFTPAAAKTGDTVYIRGKDLTGATAVSFGGTPATFFTVVDPGYIKAVVGAGTSGILTVTSPYGIVSLPGFTYEPPPVITSFSPTSGFHGTVITIVGANFINVTGVGIGGVGYDFVVVSPDTIRVTLNYSGASGNILVSTFYGTATAPGFVFYGIPVVSTINPTVGGPGTQVIITDSNFSGISSVTLGGVPVSSFTVNSSSQITAVVGAGATGEVVVTNPAGSNADQRPVFAVTHAPLIASYSPVSGPIGTIVTITGSNFGSEDIVWFGTEWAKPLTVNANSITVAVPFGASYGPLSVNSPGNGSGYDDIPFTVTFPVDPSAFNAHTFAGRTDIPAGVEPKDIVVGDLDGDGKPDVVVANSNSVSVSVYRNTSTGGQISFAPKMDLSIPGIGISNISLTDIDGDGKLDIVLPRGNDDFCVGCSGATGLVILRNRSTGGALSFDPPVLIQSYHHLEFMAVGDLDGDGKPDIAGGDLNSCFDCGRGGQVFIFQNTSTPGSVSFRENNVGFAYTWGDEGPFIGGIAIRDMNGDGRPEILVTEAPDELIVVLRNESRYGVISFDYPTLPQGYYHGYDPSYPVIADFDLDGNPDFFALGGLYRNAGNLSFTHAGYSSFYGPAFACDLNGDGKPDIAQVNYIGDSILSVYRNTGSPGTVSFAPAWNYPVLNSRKKIAAADLDGDGKPEILMANQQFNSFSILRNQAGETAPPAPAVSSFTPARGGYQITVTITGTNFSEVSAVSFGGVAASSFTVVSPTTIQAIVDTGATGAVSVVTPGGVASLPGFTYFPDTVPSIHSVSPATASAGTVITLSGIDLAGATEVRFGSKPAGAFTVVSSTSIIARVDTSTSDTIFVTTPDGIAVYTGFVFVAAPSVTAAGAVAFCSGGRVLLRSSAAVPDQWYRNGVAIAGATADSLSVDSAGNYTVNTLVNNVVSPMSGVTVVTVYAIPAKPTVTQDAGYNLVSSADSGNQWYRDGTVLLAGATGKTYKPPYSGNYSVKSTQNGCAGPMSDLYSYVSTAVSPVNNGGDYLRVTPNPVTDLVGIDFSLAGVYEITLDISDLNGRRILVGAHIHSGDKMDLSGLPRGLYVLKTVGVRGEVLTVTKILKL